MISPDDIEKRFVYYPPSDEQRLRYEGMRAKAKELALEMYSKAPDSRELSLAITKLEESVFWFNAAVARNS